MNDESIQSLIESETQRIKVTLDTEEPESCLLFPQLATTRFRRYCEGIRAANSNYR